MVPYEQVEMSPDAMVAAMAMVAAAAPAVAANPASLFLTGGHVHRTSILRGEWGLKIA